MKVFLNGGGSGIKNLKVRQILNNVINHEKPILYVPLAMDEKKHPYSGCYEWIKNELINVDVPSIYMVSSFEELYNLNYNDYSALFIGGGNTFRLLKGLKDSGSFNKIKEYLYNNGIVFGGSAGAIIFGYDIKSCECMDENNVNLIDTKGYDLLKGKSLFAHYTNTKNTLSVLENEKRIKKHTDFLMKISNEIGDIIALPEEDTIFIHDDMIEFIGTKAYYTFESGIINKIDSGISFSGLKKGK